MKIRSAFLLLLSCASVLGAATPLAKVSNLNEPGTFGAAVDVNVVNVEVYATDSSGKPVTGLRERDFELLEDGKRVSLSNFAALEGTGAAARAAGAAKGQEASAAEGREAPAQEPWNLVVFVDNFDIHPASRTRALQQVRDFLGRELTPGDRVMVATFDMGLEVRLPFSSDPAAVDAALKGIEEGATHGPAIDRARRHAFQEILSIQEVSLAGQPPTPCPQNISRPAHAFAAGRHDEVLRALGGLTVLVNSLSGVPGRKALLYVSDGIPASPGEEVFQFLAEICGGATSGGLGRQGIVHGPGNVVPDNSPDMGEQPGRGNKPRPDPNLDPLAVYDSRTLGVQAYQAASQAPLDAQSYAVGPQLKALVDHANAHRVTLYTLQASGLAAPESADASTEPGERLTQFNSIETAKNASLKSSLTALAAGTGGRAIVDVNDFNPDLARMRQDLTTYYSLGYSPSHSGDGREHKIQVKVKRAGVRLRYRESYRDKPVLEKAVDRTLAALFYGIEDNPLKIGLEVGDQIPGTDGTVSVPVSLRIPLFKVAVLNREDVYEGSLRLLLATRSADGRMTPVRQLPVPIRIPRKEVLTALGQFYVYTLTLQLAPGEQRVAVAVRDEVAATTSYLSRAVTVGAPRAAAARDPR